MRAFVPGQFKLECYCNIYSKANYLYAKTWPELIGSGEGLGKW